MFSENRPGRVVGHSLPRLDAVDKVSGKARYADDYRPAGLLYGATVRAPKPHIRIRRIDATRALAYPGVIKVISARDVPGKNRWPLVLDDYPFLADDEARFQGQAVALVAAETPAAARRAAALVTVEHDELPAVFDPVAALAPGAPLLHDDGRSGRNVFRRFDVVRGDIDAAFAAAEIVVEGEYATGAQIHAYLEPQAMIAEPSDDGAMLVHGSMQCPFYVHDAVAAALGVPQALVQIVQRTTGGGFGGKEDVPSLVAAHAALLARAVERPVKILYSREEETETLSRRHPARTAVRIAARRDGTILGLTVRAIIDGGAYATLSPVVLFRAAAHAAGAYAIAAVRVEALAVATHKAPAGAFRGFGQPQVCFAEESAIDELAARLCLDPLEVRRKNALGPGATTATGQRVDESCGLPEVVAGVAAAAGWAEKWPRYPVVSADGRRARGIGCSINHYGVGLGAGGRHIDRAGAAVQIERDGSVLVAVGQTEIGQGAKTVLAQIAAEALGAPYEAVRLVEVDTTRVPDSGPTVASRTTLVAGNAILDACGKLRPRLDAVAAARPELDFSGRAGEAYARRLPMAEHGWWISPATSFDAQGQGDAYTVYTWSANVAEVEVDLETGEVRVLRVVSGHDVGRAINPQQAAGQIEGGVSQSVGLATMESLVLDGGRVVNGGLGGYIIATVADTPEIVPILVEAPYSGGPFGAKGLAESPAIGPAAAVANAVANACGARIRDLPILPEKVWAALHPGRAVKELSPCG